MVKISVIVPVFNVEDYLKECLDSIINQTLNDLEIICVNDGSTDNSLGILEDYAKMDTRIQIISQENKGQSAARNNGLQFATGDYIYFCDSDDYLDLNALDELYSIAEEKSADLVLFKLKNFDNKTKKKFTTDYFEMNHLNHLIGKVFSYNDLGDVFKFNVTVYSKLFKRDLISNAKFLEGVIFEDNLFAMEYLFKAKRIYYHGNYLYYRRVRDNSTISLNSKKHVDVIYVYDKIFEKLKELNLHEKYNHELFNFQVRDIFNRYIGVQLKYKEYFFQEIKKDFNQFVDDCENSLDFNLIKPKNEFIYYSAINSNNHIEYNLKNDLFDIFEEMDKSDENNEFITEKSSIKKIINNLNFDGDLIDRKSILSYYIVIYKQIYSILISTRFENYVLDYIIKWCELLILSELSIQDKIDLFRFSKYLFEKCYSKKIRCNSDIKKIINLVHKNDYFEASIFSNKLQIKNNIENSIIEDIKNKEIFIIFKDLDTRLHGLIKAAFDKANLFYKAGYSVTLLNIDPIKDVNFVMDKFYKLGHLDSSIKLLNIYDYYANKNTINKEFENDDVVINLNDSIKKIENSDNSITLKYYDANLIFKEELYISGNLALKKIFNNKRVEKEYYYTYDGFNYLYKDFINNDFILFDRLNDTYISFDDEQDFQDYFVTEICLNSSQKPYLINDCSCRTPSIKNINPNIAYKIGVAHNNPYYEPFGYGSGKWYMASLEEFQYEDAVVVLVNSAKKDFIKEFKADNFHVIPNFIKNEDIEKAEKNYEKNEKTISIFARLSPDKNISDLIKAFKIVLNYHEDAVLKIFGQAYIPKEIKEKKMLEKLINELNVSSSVKFMGQTENVYEEMSKSVATVLCSNIEGFGIVIVESMINSTPVISYDTNYGPGDIIVNNENGFVVEKDNINKLSEAILNVLNNPEKAKQMGIKARQHVMDNFTEEIVLNKWENLFKELYLNDLINNNDVF